MKNLIKLKIKVITQIWLLKIHNNFKNLVKLILK